MVGPADVCIGAGLVVPLAVFLRQVMGAKCFIIMIGLITVFVGHLGAVAGKAENQVTVVAALGRRNGSQIKRSGCHISRSA